ncbi:unnamed protein product [Protopolystoma xenopodis]|uniref:Uncharacterized protein n=1 Tax=Protopolystoma xenopodis TaxID=117903 RepID=A0A448X069_9PLAT|nr:unnamed protein product [Protopolystoma xenopodis]
MLIVRVFLSILNQFLFIAACVGYKIEPVSIPEREVFPDNWVIAITWLVVLSSIIFIPAFMLFLLLTTKGDFFQVPASLTF